MARARIILLEHELAEKNVKLEASNRKIRKVNERMKESLLSAASIPAHRARNSGAIIADPAQAASTCTGNPAAWATAIHSPILSKAPTLVPPAHKITPAGTKPAARSAGMAPVSRRPPVTTDAGSIWRNWRSTTSRSCTPAGYVGVADFSRSASSRWKSEAPSKPL